jgi:uncharacterized protein involved in outer membrane biogenesis
LTPKKRTITIVLMSFITIIALFASAWFFASYQLSRLETYKDSITASAGRALNRDVSYGKGKATLTFRTGLALQFNDVVIPDKDRSTNLIVIKNAFFRVQLLPLLRNKLVLNEIILDQPRLLIKRDSSGVLNIADLLTGEKKDTGMEFRRLTIRQGVLAFADQATGGGGLLSVLGNLYCRIDSPSWGDTSRFRITSSVIEDKNRASLTLDGTFNSAPSGKPLADSKLDASIHLEGVNLHHYRPYFIKYMPFERLDGRLKVEAKLSGTVTNFTSKGNIIFKDVVFNYPQVFQGPVKSQTVSVDYALTRKNSDIKIDVVRLELDNFAASGNFSLRDMDKEDPFLEANAVTSIFSYKAVRSYVPWKIIPGGVGEFIQEHIKEGNVRLVEGKLAGRLSQLSNFNAPENAGLLTIRALADRVVFAPGGKSPAFNDISGTLELISRQFMIKGIKARFGSSSCTVEGGISDFGERGPTVYAMNMNIIPTKDELQWLFGKEALRDFKYNGSTVLYLSGKGPDDNFRIGAKWNLVNENYALWNLIEKPQGRPNQISAEVTIKKDGILIPYFKDDMPPFEVSGKAFIPFSGSGRSPLSLSIQSKAFNMHDAAGVLSVLSKLDPVGTGLVNLTARGNLQDLPYIQWNGKVSLTNVSLNPSNGVKPVNGLTGNAVFQGGKMSTSLFKATIGDSPFQAKCRMDDFRKPKTSCQFDAASLKSTDIGLQGPEGAVNFREIKGQINFEDKHVRVERLTLKSKRSVFNVSGDIQDFDNPKINMYLTSPYIRWDDVTRIMDLKGPKKLQKQGPVDNPASRMELNATLRVDTGVFNDVDLKKLNMGFRYKKGILNIETLEAGVFDGNLKTKGRVDILPGSSNRYALNLSLDKVSLEKLQNYLKYGDRFFTGNLSLTGDVTATGGNAEDFKKTAAGTFKVRAEKGVMKKFSVLSKVFSILNIYQLFKFQLPDMASNGMPYNTILADISIKDGILSSEDFFIDSDAMQISAIGKIDLVKKEIDNTIGVHPLQTIDKIVSKIPIAGWLVTDEKGNLITVHFKVEGKLDDPKVNLIPAQSISKGTQDIFRRIFQLPGKLVTNTEEVILGH